MKPLEEYKSNELESFKVDKGLLALVREYKSRSRLPMNAIIEEAIYKHLIDVGFEPSKDNKTTKRK